MTPKSLHFRYVYPTVGLFVLITLLVFILAALGSGQVREWFNPGARIKVILPADGLFGLSVGSNIEILGTKAGDVHRIVIDPEQQIHAEVRIDSDMKTFVRQGSVAVIRKRFGVAGASYLEITRGVGDPLDWDYAVLEARADRDPTESVGELIADVREKVLPVITNAQAAILAILGLVNDFRNPDGDVLQLLGNLKAISAGIARGEGAVGRLIVREDMAIELEGMLSQLSLIIRRIVPILDDLSATVGNVSGLSGKINAQAGNLPEVSQNVQELLASVNAILKDLRRTTPELPRIVKNVGETTSTLPVLLIQTQQVAVELERLIQQLQSHWLMGGTPSPPREEPGRLSPLKVSP